MQVILLVLMMVTPNDVDVQYIPQDSFKDCVENSGVGHYKVDGKDVYTSCIVGTFK